MSEVLHFEQSLTRTNVSNAMRTGVGDQVATAISQVTKQAALLRDRVGLINLDVARVHEESLQALLDTQTDEKVKCGLKALLVELTEEYGLGWSDVSKLVQVSVPAIRKWRNGGEISPSRLYSLAQLAAFLKLLRDQDVSDPAAWMATPLSSEVDRSLTKTMIYSEGHVVALLSYADHHINLEQLLNLVNAPADKLTAKTELVENEDGSLSIVPLGS